MTATPQTAIKLTDKSNKLFNLNVGHWSLISMFNFFSPGRMTSKVFLLWLMMVLADVSLSIDQQIDVDRKKIGSKLLSRRKRFIIFPTGSSFSVAVCMTIGVYGNPQFSIFSWALNYGFAYNLPSNSSYFLHPPEHVLNLPFFDPDLGDSAEEPETTTTPAPEIIHDEHHDDEHHDDEHHDDHDALGIPPTAPNTLPSAPAERKYFVYRQPQYETKPMLQRRYRRDIYKSIEGVIDK